MRRRLVTSFLGVTAIVLVLVAIPMGYLLQRVATDEVRSQLADQASFVLNRAVAADHDGVRLSVSDLEALVLGDTGAEIRYADGAVVQSNPEGDSEVISATIRNEGNVSTVRTFTGVDAIQQRMREPLLVLGGLGLAGLMATWLLAQAEARRLDGPLRDLAQTAERLGSGDFSVTAPRSGIAELDSLATTLDRTASRIDELVRAERSFTVGALRRR